MATAGHTQRRNRISAGVLIDKWKHAAVVYVRYVPDDSEKTLNGVLHSILLKRARHRLCDANET